MELKNYLKTKTFVSQICPKAFPVVQDGPGILLQQGSGWMRREVGESVYLYPE